MNNKQLIIYILMIISILLFIIITKNIGNLVLHKLCVKKEGFNGIDYDNLNSPLYSHNVDLPINNIYSCKNFCGPQSQCAITRTQCTSDIDCYGCTPIQKKERKCVSLGSEHTGKQNQGLSYSSLTVGDNNEVNEYTEIYPGSLKEKLKRPYEGWDAWTPSFNKGLELYNKKMELNYGPTIEEQKILANYPTTISATGLFYETTPPAANINTNM